MSKELEALKRIRQETCPATYMADFDKNECCDIIEKALQRLEAIDNANPSEALECLDKLAKQIELDEDTDYWEIRNAHITVEQALLKAQESKHYLKWEDLVFPYGVWKATEVVLNGKELGIRYKSDYGFMDCDYKVVKIFNLETGKCICKIYDKDKDFFDNLHLQFKKECSNCKKQHTNDCPNSGECYSKKDKPYWERVEE